MHPTKRLAQTLLNACALAQERQDQLTELTIQGWEAFPFSISTYGGPSTEGKGTATIQNGEHLDHYFFFILSGDLTLGKAPIPPCLCRAGPCADNHRRR